MKQSMTIDCIIIGYNDLDYSATLEEAKMTEAFSGFYWSLTAQSAEYMGQRISYDELLNKYLAQNTGKESNLNICQVPNLGVCYLYSYLKKRNFNVEYVNFFTHEKQRFASLLKCNPKSVAITTTYYNRNSPITEIVEFIRQHNKDTRIIVGGPHIYNICSRGSDKKQDTHFGEIGADIYVNDSQGELTLSQILGALNQTPSPDFSSIPNLIYSKGGAFDRTDRELEQNSMDENAVDWRYFDRSFLGPFVFMRTARSCAFKCAFCNYPNFAGPLNLTSLDVVEKEMSQLHDAGVKQIFFVDDTFNVPLPRFKKLLTMMIERDFGFEWYSYFRCGNADDKTFELMEKSGCKGVLLGIESGDQTILRNMNKAVKVERYKYGIQKLKEHGIISYVSIIIGFPGETWETALNTLNFIEETAPTFYAIHPYHYDKNTPIHKQAEKYDLRGVGLSWNHRTMNWREACGLLETMHRTIKRSTYLPADSMGITCIPYLQNHGISLDELKQFLEYAKGLMLEGLRPPAGFHDLPVVSEDSGSIRWSHPDDRIALSA